MGESHIFKVLFVVSLFEIIAFAVAFPLLPVLLTVPDSPLYILPGSYSVQFGIMLLGLITAAYPLGRFFSTPILGQLSDKYGRKPLLMFSIAGTVLANIVFGLGVMTANIPLLVGSKLFDGLTGGNISVVQAAVADISSNKQKAERFSKIGAAFGLGIALGPAIGGALSTGSIASFLAPSTPFFFAACLSIVSFSLVYFLLQETSPLKASTSGYVEPFRKIFYYLFRSDIRSLFLTNLLFFVGFAFFTQFSSLILSSRFGLNQLQIGGYYLLIGFFLIISRFLVVPRLFSGREEKTLLLPGITGTTIVLFLLYFIENLPTYIFTTGGFVLANSITQVAIQSSVSIGSKETDQGTALGIYSSMRALGQAFPGIIAGTLAAAYSPDIALLLASISILFSGIGYLIARQN